MNIEKFQEQYGDLRDVDIVCVDELCDHPQHIKLNKEIKKGPAKRNILKHGGKEFICRDCHMKYDNPMLHVGENRQTNELIMVYCPCHDHKGDHGRKIKKACYYGEMKEPYLQVCKSCAQLGKVISEDQREKIRIALIGIKRSDEFKNKLSNYMKNNPEGIARAFSNLIPGAGGGWNQGAKLPAETKQKMSESHSGKSFTEEHCKNISEGRKKMLKETGGFTKEHREKLSQATRRNFEKGFDPKKYHRKGWHNSPKAGEVFFHSSYEKRAYILLDRDDTVLTYNAENVRVSFYNPVKDIQGTYLIDLEVEYIDGSKKLIEIKPEAWLGDEVVIAKHEAAKSYALGQGIIFEVWSEMELFGPIYNERKIKDFVEKLDSPERKEKKKSDILARAKKHYDNVIAQDKVEVWCEYCQETHTPLRITYEKNIKRNGVYICNRYGGHLAGKKSRKRDNNPYAIEGKKKCSGDCGEILPLDNFSKGKAICKQCRAKKYKARYKAKT